MGKKLNNALNASVRNPLNADRKTDRFVGVVGMDLYGAKEEPELLAEGD